MLQQENCPKVWAGIECTVNRVEEVYVDQFSYPNHRFDLHTIDLLVSLGIKAFRFPLLWERVSQDGGELDWAERCLNALRDAGIVPIVGLLHHGSGPRDTHLLDDNFAQKFARYSELVSSRFPWVTHYTPINEPLTTARFSALYGHWYPHAKDTSAFLKALINQCRATVLAMNAIRRHCPEALLVQTEDLGKTSSSELLKYQADFENERRWLGFDLLCGRVDRTHALWKFILDHRIEVKELEWFLANSTPPDIIGVNYYVTSERYLDENIEHFPPQTIGGNGKHHYADVEAARVGKMMGIDDLIMELWKRYQIPIAITEVHLGCTREEQLRWASEIWNGAIEAREKGVDLRAVTCWSLLGSFDWCSLVTRREGVYETGVFDIRGTRVRQTQLAKLWQSFATGESFHHPVLDSPGWWRRENSFFKAFRKNPSQVRSAQGSRPIVVIGANGTLGRAFSRICEMRGLEYLACARAQLDICDAHRVFEVIRSLSPWAVINAAGYVRVDDAERNEERCRRENVVGPQNLATACSELGIPFVTFSSDLVFDGKQRSPYVESSSVSPLNVYGRSKALAEEVVLANCEGALIVRTSAFFGPWDEHNFVVKGLRDLASGLSWYACRDETISPTYLPDLVNATLDLLIDGERGIWHLANSGSLTWAEFAHLCTKLAGYSSDRVVALGRNDLGLVAERPEFSALSSERAQLLGEFESRVHHLLQVDLKHLCALS